MHTTTIQGLPWQPCAQCPRRVENGGNGNEGVCPSRRHPGYCGEVDKSFAAWRDHIRNEPDEDRPGREIPQTPEPAPVGLLTRAANFAAAVVQHVATGMQEADGETVLSRLATCKTCEHYRESDGTCGGGGCGCYVQAKAKWLDQRCPFGKW